MGSGTTFCLYREVQRFWQLWLWLLVAGVSGVSIWSFVQQIILGKPFGQNPAPDVAVVIIAAIFGLGFPVLFYAVNLTTEVRTDGLYVRFFPFHLTFRRMPSESVIRYEVLTYRPIRDYGGWGIRYGRGGKAYNVSGDRGVMLELSDGSRLLIGSQKPEELANAMGLAMGENTGWK
ncbi:MAG: hypothetical protein JW753_05030 [Dehalococcoidia bacterium]|nr:hypothetical protein [Dehalococcoidia bacterium]